MTPRSRPPHAHGVPLAVTGGQAVGGARPQPSPRIVPWGAVSLLSIVTLAVTILPTPGRSDETRDAARSWHTELSRGQEEARARRQPILVKVGADWCPYCRKLDEEVTRPEARKAFERWTLVALDADAESFRDEVRRLGVGPIPALRILSPAGRVVASRDGALTAAELVGWLDTHYEKATEVAIDEIAESGPPTAVALVRLVHAFEQPDAAVREVAIHRLQDHPNVAGAAVVDAFARGSLQSRLATLELLGEWKAPIDGLDPWRPETVTNARLKALRDWAGQAARPAGPPTDPPTPEQLALAGRELDALATAPAGTVPAIRERLARLGRGLMPVVLDRLKHAETDQARERLTALRYRLVASDALALRWTGGLERLAATDVNTRHQAVDELVRRAAVADEPLLLELFNDPDPLVREVALRGLDAVGGGGSSGALIGLLADPEPNVRAAVLKQLAEHPTPKLLPKLADYVARESDPDLIVHAVRVLREMPKKKGLKPLIALLNHANWSVRAEAAEGIGKQVEDLYGQPDATAADAYAALIGRLDDPDGFVVGRALGALKHVDLESAVEPLVRAARTHPDLAAEAVTKLGYGMNTRPKALPHLRALCTHPRPDVRAAAVAVVSEAANAAIEPEVQAALTDAESVVRIAAATELFQKLNSLRPSGNTQVVGMAEEAPEPPPTQGPLRPALGGEPGAEPPKPALTPEAGVEVKVEGPKARAEPQENEIDAWLASFQTGKNRPGWIRPAVGPLSAMMKARAAEERLTAALPLVALGGEAESLRVLIAAAREKPDLIGHAADALPWRQWAERLELFDTLVAIGPGEDEVAELARSMVAVRDARAADPLWRLAARADLTPHAADVIADGLKQIYFGSQHYKPSAISKANRRRAAAAVRPRAESGPDRAREIALALLLSADVETAAAVARAVVDEPKAAASLRRDAFQIFLLARDRASARKVAVEALGRADPGMARLALLYLTSEADSLGSLHDGISLDFDRQAHAAPNRSFNAPSLPTLPSSLKPETVRPLLTAGDPETAALAAFVLVLLDDPGGLGPLLNYWRDPSRREGIWARRVYQAIAHLDDDASVPLLEQMYAAGRSNSSNPWTAEIRDFYWTIRVMTGPIAHRLRERVRHEIGMPYLRGEGDASNEDAP